MDLPDNNFIVGYFSSRFDRSEMCISTQHVNTVYNRHQKVSVVNKTRFKHKKIQNSTARVSGNRFVKDKKKTFTIDGCKNTRIEFTEAARRSSNYTANAPTMHHTLYHSFFDLLCLAHGEYVEHVRPPIMNNTNYTSCLYGITNQFIIFVRMFMNESQYVRPILFPCTINAKTFGTRHAIFTSMYINWQRVEPYNIHRLGSYITGIESYMECDVYLCRLCTALFLKNHCFLNTANKVLVLWLNELYHMYLPLIMSMQPLAESYHWYENFIMLYYDRYANAFTGFCANLMNQHRFKNLTFNQCVPFILFRVSLTGWNPDVVWPVVRSYFRRIRLAGPRYRDTSIEFRLIVQACVHRSKKPSRPGHVGEHGGRLDLTGGGDVLLINGRVALRGLGVRTGEVADLSREDRLLLYNGIEQYCELVYYTVLCSDTKEGSARGGD